MTHSASRQTQSGSATSGRIDLTTVVTAVRRHPGMYVGGTDGAAVATLVGHALASLLPVPGSTTEPESASVTIHADRSVTLRGSNVRVPTTVDAWTTLKVRERDPEATADARSRGVYHRSIEYGDNLELVLLNACSEYVEVGEPPRALRLEGGRVVRETTSALAGRLRFRPDPRLFDETDENGHRVGDYHIELPLIGRLCDDLATVCSGCRVRLEDERHDYDHTFHYPHGVHDRCRAALARPGVITAPVVATARVGSSRIDMAFRFVQAGPTPVEGCLVSWPIVRTLRGGTHVQGLLSGVRDVLANHRDVAWPLPDRGKWNEAAVQHALSRLGLQIVAVAHQGPEEELKPSCGGDELRGGATVAAPVRKAVRDAMSEQVDDLFLHQLGSILGARRGVNIWEEATQRIHEADSRLRFTHRAPVAAAPRTVTEASDVEVCLEDLPFPQRLFALHTAVEMIEGAGRASLDGPLRPVSVWLAGHRSGALDRRKDAALPPDDPRREPVHRLLAVYRIGPGASLRRLAEVIDACAEVLVQPGDLVNQVQAVMQAFRERWWEVVRCRLAFRDAGDADVDVNPV